MVSLKESKHGKEEEGEDLEWHAALPDALWAEYSQKQGVSISHSKEGTFFTVELPDDTLKIFLKDTS